MDPAHLPQVYGPDEQAQIQACMEVLPSVTTDVEAIFSGWGAPVMDARFLDPLRGLRAVFYAGGSVRPFATTALWERGIRVVTAAAANARPTAEFAFAEIVFSLKRAWPHFAGSGPQLRWPVQDPLMPGAYRSVVGLLSLGRTGRMVAEFLRMLEVKVVAYDPLVTPAEAAMLGAQLTTLDEVFARSDVVSCHMPLLPATTRVLGRAHFAALRRGATFINTARGAIVREDELIGVLQARPDLTAVLDVTDPEPPAKDSPLRQLPNVVLTPHLAGSLGPECRRLGSWIAREAARYVQGEPLQGEVGPSQLATIA